MNPVLILSYNNLEALKTCVDSVRKQDIETDIFVIDNGSDDDTRNWVSTEWPVSCWLSPENRGVTWGWNRGLSHFFNELGMDHVLVLNQDLVLGASFYSRLLSFDVPFVTGTPVDTAEELTNLEPERINGPCFSAFLIRRSCWEAIGEFDPRFFSWCNDCDYDVRAHLSGIKLWKSTVPFIHTAGTTMRTAPPEEKKWFGERANADRSVFKSIYGVEPCQPGYDDLFMPELFGVKK